MHLVSLFVEGYANPFQLRYDDPEKAGIDHALAAESVTPFGGKPGQTLTFKDDYGQSVTVYGALLRAAILQDLSRDLDAQVAMVGMQHAAQARAERQRAPVLVGAAGALPLIRPTQN